MGDISQGVQSLNLMSLFKSPLGPFFGDLELCYGKNWNSFWKYLSGEVCTYLSLDHPCTGGLFQGPYILLSLKYFLWFTAISRAFLWHQKPITGIVWEHVYIVHVLARVYMHVLVHNRKICIPEGSWVGLMGHVLFILWINTWPIKGWFADLKTLTHLSWMQNEAKM